jgi:cytochrome c peroxidase
MGMPSLALAVERIAGDPGYRAGFAQAFGDAVGVTAEHLLAALAAFERTLITPDAPYDRFVRGEAGALTRQQLRGMALFESLGCVSCHSGPNFSGASVFGDGAAWRAFPALGADGLEAMDLTRDGGVAPAGGASGVWRIPSLRNVALTAPYFHNGSVQRLDEAVRIMLRAQLGLNVQNSPQLAVTAARSLIGEPAVVLIARPTVTEADVQSLVAFLRSLSADFAALRADRR